jgi:hypothetical protein
MPANRPEGLQTRTTSNKIVTTTLDELGISSKLTTEQTTALGRRSVENEPELKNIRPKKIPALHLKPDEQMYDDMMAIMELLGMKNNKTMTIRMALSNYRQQLEKEKGSR